MYNIPNKLAPSRMREFRKKMKMSQAEFAAFVGVSRPTIERAEKSSELIVGPLAMLVNILADNVDYIKTQEFPTKELPLRLFYMYDDKCCTLIDVDEANQQIRIKNFVTNIYFLAFGANKNPSYEDYTEFLESRCFPATRDKMKIQLEMLGLPFYDPLLIIEKTNGRMAEDNFWIKIER